MLLHSRDGGSVELLPVGYEFDEPPWTEQELADEDDWPDEWLLIRGHVRTEDHREWSFTQPCITTQEAAELAAWLTQVAEGHAPVPPRYFCEPNVGFSVEEAGADRARVRVHFSHESMPPWNPRHDWPDYMSYFLVVDVNRSDLRAAAQQWRTEVAPFPPRLPPPSAPGRRTDSA